MKKRKKLEKHHIIPSSRGGTNDDVNILMIDTRRHRAWHLLFSNKIQDEIFKDIIYKWYKGNITEATRQLFWREIVRSIQKEV